MRTPADTAPIRPGRGDRRRVRDTFAGWLGLHGRPTTRFRLFATGWVLLALALSGLHMLLTWQLKTESGLTQAFFQGVGGNRTLLVERLTRTVDLHILEEDERLPRRLFSVRWTGVWHVPQQGFFDIYLNGDDRVTMTVDGQPIQEQSPASPARNPRTVLLGAGFHDIEMDYEHLDGASTLAASWAPFGGPPRPLDPEHLFPRMPGHPQLRALRETTGSMLRWLGLISLAALLYVGLLGLFRSGPRLLTGRTAPSAVLAIGRAVAIGLPVLVVVYGAILRLDALTLTRGAVASPQWLQALQQSRGQSSALRPSTFSWTPVVGRYISDPYTYLQYAREMRSFYAAHRREPVFPFVTKVFLRLLDQQDIAVSFASASFSVLAIAATFLLGTLAFSYWIGLGAALAMAIEYDVVSWSVGGWRDDAFTCAVVFSAYAMLRYSRAASRRNAVLMGMIAGLACLIRITSLSFLLPGFAYLYLTSRRPVKERLAGIGLGLLLMTVLVAPFMINCWRAFGDPLYAINVHANVYRTAEGQTEQSGLTAAAYIESTARNRPFQSLDTVVLGLTAYPFENKWRGFDQWVPSLGTWLSRASLLGLILLMGSTTGRLLLVVLVASLVPYAVTWKLISDWRFTEHAYPIFLIASCVAIGQIVTWPAPSRISARLTQRGHGLKPLVFWALIASSVGIGVWTITRVLPVLTVRESLLAMEAVTITAGERDTSFFTDGWSGLLPGGNVTTRVSQGSYSVVRLPLPRRQDYHLTLRLDPFPRPLGDASAGLPAVRVFMNGSLVARLDLRWNPERVGSYDIRLPSNVVKKGFNRLELLADVVHSEPLVDDWPPQSKGPDHARFSLWYVRVRP